MQIDEVLRQVYSFNSKQLIPITSILTEEDKQREGYIIGYTLSEWETEFPDLPLDSKWLSAFR